MVLSLTSKMFGGHFYKKLQKKCKLAEFLIKSKNKDTSHFAVNQLLLRMKMNCENVMCKTDYHHIKAMRCLFCIQPYIFMYSNVLPEIVYSLVFFLYTIIHLFTARYCLTWCTVGCTVKQAEQVNGQGFRIHRPESR